MTTVASTNARASVFQGTKIAPETVPGTAASSGFKKLTALGMTPTIKPVVKVYRPMGGKYTTATALNREETSWAVDGIPTYTEIVYPLSSILTEASITAASGTTSAAAGSRVMGADGTHWFFKPSAYDADAPVSFTVYKGGITAAERATFWRMSDFTLTYNRSDTAIAGSAIGRAIESGLSMPGNEVQQVAISATGGTFTLTYAGQTTSAIVWNASAAVLLAAIEALSNIPAGAMRVTQTVAASPLFTYTVEFGGSLGETNVAAMTSSAASLTGGASTATITTPTSGSTISSIALTAIPSTDICIYAFSSAQTSISTTTNETSAFRLTDVMEVSLSVGSRYVPYYTLDCTQTSYRSLVEGVPKLQLKTKMMADSIGLGYLTQLRNGGTVYFRVKATSSAVISSAEFYELTYDFAGKIADGSDLGDSDGITPVTWTWEGVPSLTNGGPLEFAAVNNVTAL